MNEPALPAAAASKIFRPLLLPALPYLLSGLALLIGLANIVLYATAPRISDAIVPPAASGRQSDAAAIIPAAVAMDTNTTFIQSTIIRASWVAYCPPCLALSAQCRPDCVYSAGPGNLVFLRIGQNVVLSTVDRGTVQCYSYCSCSNPSSCSWAGIAKSLGSANIATSIFPAWAQPSVDLNMNISIPTTSDGSWNAQLNLVGNSSLMLTSSNLGNAGEIYPFSIVYEASS